MTRLPFWSDDFDMDLLRVLPQTEEILGGAAQLELVTVGNLTHGRLNHPCCWNTNAGLTAFFGFETPAKPKCFVSFREDQLVRCTFLEAVRDAWSHHYLMLVECQPVWDAQRLWPIFQDLMFNLRGWSPLPEHRTKRLLADVELSLVGATSRLRAISTGRWRCSNLRMDPRGWHARLAASMTTTGVWHE